MRKYALVILDMFDTIIDRYNLDLVTDPKNNGFELNMSTLAGDIENIITKVVQKKNTITMVINQIDDAYFKANTLASWIQKYSNKEYRMALEYNDGELIRYCEGRVTKLTKDEKVRNNILLQTLEFTQTTPYFLKLENTITISQTNYGKKYPFKYPYSYGGNKINNNNIDNEYILEVPLILVLYGTIYEPTIELSDETGDYYSRVKLNDIILKNERLLINSAQRKIYRITASGDVLDETPKIDPKYDTFLRAKGNTTSKISINYGNGSSDFKMIGGWRQYIL